VNITGACQFGQANEVLVRTQDVRGVIDGDVPYAYGGDLIESVTGKVLAPVGSQSHLMGIWQDVDLVLRSDVYIEDVTVATSVRQSQIDATYVLRNLGGGDRTVDLSAEVMDDAVTALDMGTAQVVVPAGSTATATLTQPWTDPELWMPDNPHLYQLESSIGDQSGELDATSIRFGFREFWTEDGIYFVLNGTRMKFLATAGHPPWGGELLTDQQVLDKYNGIRGANCMAMRLHANIWPENWYEVADEIGLPVILESAIWCYSWNYALGDSAFWQNVRDHWEGVIKAHKNPADHVRRGRRSQRCRRRHQPALSPRVPQPHRLPRHGVLVGRSHQRGGMAVCHVGVGPPEAALHGRVPLGPFAVIPRLHGAAG